MLSQLPSVLQHVCLVISLEHLYAMSVALSEATGLHSHVLARFLEKRVADVKELQIN